MLISSCRHGGIMDGATSLQGTWTCLAHTFTRSCTIKPASDVIFYSFILVPIRNELRPTLSNITKPHQITICWRYGSKLMPKHVKILIISWYRVIKLQWSRLWYLCGLIVVRNRTCCHHNLPRRWWRLLSPKHFFISKNPVILKRTKC